MKLWTHCATTSCIYEKFPLNANISSPEDLKSKGVHIWQFGNPLKTCRLWFLQNWHNQGDNKGSNTESSFFSLLFVVVLNFQVSWMLCVQVECGQIVRNYLAPIGQTEVYSLRALCTCFHRCPLLLLHLHSRRRSCVITNCQSNRLSSVDPLPTTQADTTTYGPSVKKETWKKK